MRYVGLDVSYRNVGVVILDNAGDCVSMEHRRCKSIRDPEGFAWHLAQAEDILRPWDVVSVEGLSFGSIGRSHVLAGAHAMWLKTAFEACHLVFVPVPIRVKIWATDDAKAKKDKMIRWAHQFVSRSKISEHEADALALAKIARSGYLMMEYGLAPGTTERQASILYNSKQTGLTQVEDQSFYRGRNGER